MTDSDDRSPFAARHLLVTVALVALVTSIAFEAMAISTAMPVVARDLGALRSYGLAFSVMLTTQLLGIVLAGVWTERAGAAPAVLTGVGLFGGGSLTCALAGTLGAFLAGRAVAGLGGGLVVVALYVVIGRLYPAAAQPRLFAAVSAAWVLPSLVGPPVAAAITQATSWRWVFGAVTVLVAVVAGVLLAQLPRLVAADRKIGAGRRSRTQHRRDVVLGAAVALAAGALQWGSQELQPGWSPHAVVALAGAAGVVALAPVLLPWRTWVLGRGLPSVYLARFVCSASFFGCTTYVPLMLTQERGLPLRTAGLVVAAGSVGWATGSWVQGRDAFDGRRHRLVTAAGAALAGGIGGLAWVAWSGSSWWWCALAMPLAGLGMGLGTSAASVLALTLVPPQEHGDSGSSLMLADTLGSVLGIAAAGAAFAAWHDPRGDGHLFGLSWAVLAALSLVLLPAGQRVRT